MLQSVGSPVIALLLLLQMHPFRRSHPSLIQIQIQQKPRKGWARQSDEAVQRQLPGI